MTRKLHKDDGIKYRFYVGSKRHWTLHFEGLIWTFSSMSGIRNWPWWSACAPSWPASVRTSCAGPTGRRTTGTWGWGWCWRGVAPSPPPRSSSPITCCGRISTRYLLFPVRYGVKIKVSIYKYEQSLQLKLRAVARIAEGPNIKSRLWQYLTFVTCIFP